MSRLLYIQASPRGERSKSISTANAFIKAYKEKNPSTEIDVLNIFEETLADFGPIAVKAKYTVMHGQSHTEEELTAWKDVEKNIERFKSADKYVFAVPMWNFSIPWRLKQYIDILIQPTYTFVTSEEGYKGLLENKKVFISYARGGDYSSEQAKAYDLQSKYFELILGFMGLTDIRSVVIEPTLMEGPDVANEKLEQAKSKAGKLAIDF
ncbi:MAG: FMN-dependent NADH-azoreductase [Planctomycetota bacterium]|jgi:FMN-dependent NADH-azoreductase